MRVASGRPVPLHPWANGISGTVQTATDGTRTWKVTTPRSEHTFTETDLRQVTDADHLSRYQITSFAALALHAARADYAHPLARHDLPLARESGVFALTSWAAHWADPKDPWFPFLTYSAGRWRFAFAGEFDTVVAAAAWHDTAGVDALVSLLGDVGSAKTMLALHSPSVARSLVAQASQARQAAR